ncbi:MAG TPA: protoporphyrinogen oxidase HemJ [Alphaproteobacteria bacterium]|nr:protoporphyrinogen oxidase HemJ [Alphaproteobacteria bacterium]
MAGSLYLWIKAAHVVSLIAWMAGMFYLPRLFVYHTQVASGSEAAAKFEVMEAKLLRVIMRPAMAATWILGITLLVLEPGWLSQGWLHVKLLAVLLMSGLHGVLARWQKSFAAGENTRTEKFYRLINEVPTLLLVVIVVMVIVKPF